MTKNNNRRNPYYFLICMCFVFISYATILWQGYGTLVVYTSYELFLFLFIYTRLFFFCIQERMKLLLERYLIIDLYSICVGNTIVSVRYFWSISLCSFLGSDCYREISFRCIEYVYIYIYMCVCVCVCVCFCVCILKYYVSSS